MIDPRALRRDIAKAFARHRAAREHLQRTSLSAEEMEKHEAALEAILRTHFRRVGERLVPALAKKAAKGGP